MIPHPEIPPEPFALTDAGYVFLSGAAEIVGSPGRFGRSGRRPRILHAGDVVEPLTRTLVLVKVPSGTMEVELLPDVSATAAVALRLVRVAILACLAGTGTMVAAGVAVAYSGLFLDAAAGRILPGDVVPLSEEIQRRANAGETGFVRRRAPIDEEDVGTVSGIIADVFLRASGSRP